MRLISPAGTRRRAQTRTRLRKLHFLFVLASRISFKTVPLFPSVPGVKHLNPRDAQTRQHRMRGRRRNAKEGDWKTKIKITGIAKIDQRHKDIQKRTKKLQRSLNCEEETLKESDKETKKRKTDTGISKIDQRYKIHKTIKIL